MRRCLNTVRYSAENNYGLNPDRLVVGTRAAPCPSPAPLLTARLAEASVGRQTPRTKPLIQGRSHAGWESKPYTMLRLVLREAPPVIGELRVGVWGKEAKFKPQQQAPTP